MCDEWLGNVLSTHAASIPTIWALQIEASKEPVTVMSKRYRKINRRDTPNSGDLQSDRRQMYADWQGGSGISISFLGDPAGGLGGRWDGGVVRYPRATTVSAY